MPNRDLIPFLGFTDPFSSLVHLAVLVVFALLARTLLEGARRDPQRLLASRLFLLCCPAMYLCSVVYHALPNDSAWRPLFWHLDHGAIWLALASCLSCAQATFFGRWSWGPVWRRILWGLALTGCALELTVLSRYPGVFDWVSPLLYVGIGWMGFPMVLAMWTRKARARRVVATLLFVGGLFATVGGIVDALAWPTLVPRVVEAHECMHVLTGTAGVWWITPHWIAARDAIANARVAGPAASGSGALAPTPAAGARPWRAPASRSASTRRAR